MRLVLLSLLVAGVALAAPVQAPPIAKKKSNRMMATAPGGSLNVDWVSKTINKDGSSILQLAYQNASGAQISTRTIMIDAACTVAKDQFGTVLANPPPSSFCTSVSTEVTQTNALITAAAAANKLNL